MQNICLLTYSRTVLRSCTTSFFFYLVMKEIKVIAVILNRSETS